jgi:integrase
VIEGCKFTYFAAIDAGKVLAFLTELRAGTAGRRGRSAQTFNFYLAAVKQFCRWAVRNRRAGANPVDHLEPLNVRTDRRRDRRALTADELRTLITLTAAGPTRNNTPGTERALLYRLAVETGLRAKELRSLTPASFDLTAGAPTVTVAAAYSKRRREDTLPLRPALVPLLRGHLATRLPAAPAFRLPKCRKETAKMFRADVEAAGIAYRDGAGLVADFHALRHTFITNLARGGVHPKVVQALARHSTITLTMDRYSRTLVEEQADALKVLPDLSRPVVGVDRATGTDGRVSDPHGPNDLASCLARSQRFGETSGGANGLPGGGA